jgi:hypothetical protein
MKFCDQNENILEWSSEEIAIPYLSPIDGRIHRYYVDFWIKAKEKDGSIRCRLIEIKPEKQTVMPKKPKKQTRRFLNEMATWAINSSKWEAAKNFCKSSNMDFLVLTEKHLFKK